MNACNVIIITDHIRKSLTPQIEWTVGCSIQRDLLMKPLATLSRKQVLQSFHDNFETEQITHDTARLITARSPSKTLLPSRIKFLFYIWNQRTDKGWSDDGFIRIQQISSKISTTHRNTQITKIRTEIKNILSLSWPQQDETLDYGSVTIIITLL